MPLDHILNRDILHSLRFNCVLSRFRLDGKGKDKEERNMRFSFYTPREISQGLNRIWESKLGTPSLDRIIQDIDMELKALEIVYRANFQRFQHQIDILDNPLQRMCSHFRFPYTLQSSGDFLWYIETEAHIPLLLVCSLTVSQKNGSRHNENANCARCLY